MNETCPKILRADPPLHKNQFFNQTEPTDSSVSVKAVRKILKGYKIF